MTPPLIQELFLKKIFFTAFFTQTCKNRFFCCNFYMCRGCQNIFTQTCKTKICHCNFYIFRGCQKTIYSNIQCSRQRFVVVTSTFAHPAKNYLLKCARLKFVSVTFTFAEAGQRQSGEKSFVQPLGLFSHSQVLRSPFDQNKALLDQTALPSQYLLLFWLN